MTTFSELLETIAHIATQCRDYEREMNSIGDVSGKAGDLLSEILWQCNYVLLQAGHDTIH